jgi:hypothetical protein
LTTIHLPTATLEILPDDTPDNPRTWDDLSVMACWHRRYRLGDAHDFCDPRAFAQAVHAGNAVILPLYLMDHSGLTLSTDPAAFRACDPQGWDWGQVGYVYALHADIRMAYGVQRITRRIRDEVSDHLRATVQVYTKYLRGDVYGFLLTDRTTGDVIDSCWGFYGADVLVSGMADHFPTEYRDDILAHLHQLAA